MSYPTNLNSSGGNYGTSASHESHNPTQVGGSMREKLKCTAIAGLIIGAVVFGLGAGAAHFTSSYPLLHKVAAFTEGGGAALFGISGIALKCMV